MNIYLKIWLMLLVTSLALDGYGQDLSPIAKKQRQRQFYSQTLQLDSTKTDQVVQIQDAYKAGLKLVMADTSLNDLGRRAKIQALMEVKNGLLKKLLTLSQQEKIIPTTERVSVKSQK